MADWTTAYEASPAGSDNPKYGDDKIRELKGDIRAREEHESVWKDSTTDVGGVHRKGSAKSYYQATAPTTKPFTTDGPLDDNDAGRTWIDSDTQEEYVYDDVTDSFKRVNRGVQCLVADPTVPIQGEEWLRTDLV